jgi:hypothetical protein
MGTPAKLDAAQTTLLKFMLGELGVKHNSIHMSDVLGSGIGQALITKFYESFLEDLPNLTGWKKLSELQPYVPHSGWSREEWRTNTETLGLSDKNALSLWKQSSDEDSTSTYVVRVFIYLMRDGSFVYARTENFKAPQMTAHDLPGVLTKISNEHDERTEKVFDTPPFLVVMMGIANVSGDSIIHRKSMLAAQERSTALLRTFIDTVK